MKPKMLLCGPFVGELYWEVRRANGYARHVKTRSPNTKIGVMCYRDRVDLWTDIADKDHIKFVDDYIPNYKKYLQDCWRLTGYSTEKYYELAKSFEDSFAADFDIYSKMLPDLNRYCNRKQFSIDEFNFNFRPRLMNYIMMDDVLDIKKKTIVVAPRHRKIETKRNWGGEKWEKLYDLLDGELSKDIYQIVIVGKKGDYYPDPKRRFIDINHVRRIDGTSLIGLSLATLDKSHLILGSQSAIPNIGYLMMKTVLSWGNEREDRHTAGIEFNPMKNKNITFIDREKFNLSPDNVFKEIKKLL